MCSESDWQIHLHTKCKRGLSDNFRRLEIWHMSRINYVFVLFYYFEACQSGHSDVSAFVFHVTQKVIRVNDEGNQIFVFFNPQYLKAMCINRTILFWSAMLWTWGTTRVSIFWKMEPWWSRTRGRRTRACISAWPKMWLGRWRPQRSPCDTSDHHVSLIGSCRQCLFNYFLFFWCSIEFETNYTPKLIK